MRTFYCMQCTTNAMASTSASPTRQSSQERSYKHFTTQREHRYKLAPDEHHVLVCILVVAVVFIYMSSKELSLGLSSGRPGKVITNLPCRPAPKTSRKNGSL